MYDYYEQHYPDGKVFYHLDIGTVSDEEYDKLKPIIEHLGGHWREKFKCFVFGEDVRDKIDYYMEHGVKISERYKWQEETQFYPTPTHVAKRLVALADIKPNMTLLEPSAGTGNLLDEIPVKCQILGIEPLMQNSDVLRKKGYNHCVETFEEFAEHSSQKFDRVLMNPPYSGQRDVKHFMMAYKMLKNNGVLAAIISENALYYETDLSKNFRKFLKDNNAYIENVPIRSFEESGTTIETVIVTIKKVGD